MNINNTNYRYRLLARLVLQAETPLAIGCGESDITTDSLVARDVNGLPYIPGTSLAGVLRGFLEVDDESKLWGYQVKEKGRGSEVIFSEGKILDSKGEVVDGIIDPYEVLDDPLLSYYVELPIRQHVSINERGVASKTGKFDQQIVYKGTQFCFEMEIVSESGAVADIEIIVNALRSKSFRIGGGTRNGYGKLKVVSAKTIVLDLKDDLTRYLSKSSNLQEASEWWNDVKEGPSDALDDERFANYELCIEPLDFFVFGSGYGDDTGAADSTSVKEGIVKDGKFEGGKTLIPATSVKGAVRHRVAFHYNKFRGKRFGDPEAAIASTNLAVRELFGYNDGKKLYRGKVIISDVFEAPAKSVLMTHVAIDRFTGGAEKGALFTEQTDYGKGMKFRINISVDKSAFDKDSDEQPILKAFEETLTDICKGMLPLGGSVNRGHGIFNGSLAKDGNVIYPKE